MTLAGAFVQSTAHIFNRTAKPPVVKKQSPGNCSSPEYRLRTTLTVAFIASRGTLPKLRGTTLEKPLTIFAFLPFGLPLRGSTSKEITIFKTEQKHQIPTHIKYNYHVPSNLHHHRPCLPHQSRQQETRSMRELYQRKHNPRIRSHTR